MINKKSYFVYLIFFTSLYSNESINTVIDQILLGNLYINQDSNLDDVILEHENSSSAIFLEGLINIDGELAIEFFETYYSIEGENKYDEMSVKKIADYYYSKGSYIKASKWFKIILEDYPESYYLESSINYYLNSLLISGKFEVADSDAEKYKNKYPELNLNLTKSNKLDDNISDFNITYSVLVGNYKRYRDALEFKKNLSKDGLLCRIENIEIDNATYYSLKIGYYKDKQTADSIIKRLKSRLGINDAVIIGN